MKIMVWHMHTNGWVHKVNCTTTVNEKPKNKYNIYIIRIKIGRDFFTLFNGLHYGCYFLCFQVD